MDKFQHLLLRSSMQSQMNLQLEEKLINMNEKREWQRVANMERRTKNYKKNVKQRCIRNIAKGILKKHRVPVYKKDQNGQLLTDQDGNKIPKMRSYKNKNGQRKTHLKTRKLRGFDDFKKHFSVIPNRTYKKFNLVLKIVNSIAQINELKSKTTNLNEIANDYSKRLQSLESSLDNSDQSQQQNNMNTDQANQHNQIDSNKFDSDNSDKNKNQNSDQFDFDDPNSNNSSNDNPGKMPGD